MESGAPISLSYITQCAICLQTWTDPRSLPSCDHTFCLQCVKTYVQKKDEENEDLACPICRKKFTVPQKGLDVLAKNFIHQQLLDARIAALMRQKSSATTKDLSRELARDPTVLCEVCEGNFTATRYCIDCDQNMCRTCSTTHLRIRSVRNHKVVDISEKQLRSSYCEQHEEERVKMYCEGTGCRKLLCTLCDTREHVGHKCMGIMAAAQGFVAKITGYNVNMNERITKTKGCLEELRKRIEEFLANISETEKMLTGKKEDLIQLIEAEHTKLWNELKYIEERRLNNDLKVRVEEMENELLVLQSFQAKAKELIDNGSACDICRSANDIITKANSLINSEKNSTLQMPEPIKVNFTPAKIPDVSGSEIHLIGMIECNGSLLELKKPYQMTLDQMFDKMATDTSEILIKLNQSDSKLKLKTSEVDEIKKDKELLETRLNDTKELKDLHAEAKTDLHKQIQQLQQQITDLRNKHSQEEEVHKKETQKLQAKIKEAEADNHKLNIDQQQLMGKLDEMTRLKDQHAKNELELKGKLNEMNRIKYQYVKTELQLKRKLYEINRLKHHQYNSFQKQIEDLQDDLRRSKDVIIQNDDNMKTLEEQLKQVEEKHRKLDEAIEPVRSTLFLSQSSLVRVIDGAGQGIVDGIAVLGSELFIVRADAASVEVYDVNNITTTPCLLEISGETLNCPRIAVCSQYNCLYVAHDVNKKDSVIYRLELSNSSVTDWAVKGDCEGISVTNNGNLLAIIMRVNCLKQLEWGLQEYTTHGSLVRYISLDSSIDYPVLCIQLSDGNFVICDLGLTQERVCIVNASGRILKSYGGSQESGVDELNGPRHLSVDCSGHVFVADYYSDRVLLLSPTLTLLGTVQTPGQQLKWPTALHLDENSRRLYIGEDSGRVLVVELSIGEK